MSDKRNSIRPTYDSRETGPRYHITSALNGRPLVFQQRMPDPFAHHTVTVGRWDLLRGLFRGRLIVEVTVGADADVVEDVMELDDNYLGPNCTRRDAFNSHLMEAAGRMVNGES